MNAAHHIAQAEKALHTGQPTLATRHMQRAIEYTTQDRAQHDKDYRTAQAQLRAHRMNQSLTGYFTGLAEIVTEAFKPFTKLVQAAIAANHTRASYALAGPTKGTP